MKTDPQRILDGAIKDVLVAASAGEDVSEPLQQLEQAMMLAHPGWCVSKEISTRLAENESKESNPDEEENQVRASYR